MAMSPRKTKATGSTRTASEHPPLWVMLKAAIVNLKERKGSSRQAIMKYIESNYKVHVSDGKFKSAMKRCISKAIAENKLLKTKASFKISHEEKATKKPKAAGAKKVKKAPGTSKKSVKPKAPRKPKAKVAKTVGSTGGATKKARKPSAKPKKAANKPKGAGKK